ncbi:MAG TPA: penicillin-binding protein 2, partial [Candidatus Manganitrophaceae bacterium]
HLLGYVGEISQAQLESGIYPKTESGAVVGQYGIEQTYDTIIRGAPGQKGIEVDALGHEVRLLSVKEPVQGDDVFLTLDLNVQKAAEEALGKQAGVIVAMDPRTGEVLAMASHPAFNPNVLSEGASVQEWEALLNDPEHPLTNRAIQGQYPPGSTFKIVLSAAILEEKEIPRGSRVDCRGFLPFGNRLFRDWKREGHGSVDLRRAIVESCDVYFYQMGDRLGVDTIAKFAFLFGLGKPTGVGLASEKGGLIPTVEWKEKARKEPWFPGETLSVSIGQGYVSTTPLQLNAMISAVAAHGVWRPPQLLKKSRDRETGAVRESEPLPGRRLPISAETLQTIKNALAGVVSDPKGTAFSSRSKYVSIAGKTGTAQVVGLKVSQSQPDEFKDHAWFVSYAPVEDPQIAVTVLVEHGGHGGSVAA